jgi:predicted SprT family Zn-dependent metalloprotease
VRKTQLYKTIPHEFGHHVHYSEFEASHGYEKWLTLPKNVKEQAAFAYADTFTKNYSDKINPND